jgi:hypothetical protein
VLAAAVVPSSLATMERSRATTATRYLAGRMSLARAEAVKRSAYVGLRFEEDQSAGIAFRTFVDGNRDGVRTRDIASGVDVPIEMPIRLSDLFPGVAIALSDRSGPRDPVQVGSSNILSFAPVGTATSGTVYIRGRDGTQLGVRVLGATGRTRILRYEPRTDRWLELAW